VRLEDLTLERGTPIHEVFQELLSARFTVLRLLALGISG